MSIVVVLTAFAGGLVSFLSPCVLPLVPGYLSIISGYSLDQLKGNAQSAILKRSVVKNSIMFIIGFSITFILLGATATWLGQILRARMQILYRIAEMLEGRSQQFVYELVEQGMDVDEARTEVALSIDRFLYYSGWADNVLSGR